MIWTECPRCQGEVGNWCGGACHQGGLYVCEACGHAEEENSEECPCCGKVDEDMRAERLKAEADDGNQESAAELYALESGDHDKAALRAAFLAGVRWVGEPTVNAELLEALKALLKWNPTCRSGIDDDAFGATTAAARAAIAKAEGGNQ